MRDRRLRRLAAALAGLGLLAACAAPAVPPATPTAAGPRVPPPLVVSSPAPRPSPAPTAAPSQVPSPSPTPALPSASPPTGSAVSPAAAPSASPTDPVASILTTLSLDEKVGQLFLLGFDGSDAAGAATAIGDLRAGGIALVANVRTADEATALTRALRQRARAAGVLPLLIAVDQEGGQVQRLRQGVTQFGPNARLGALPLAEGVAAACAQGQTQGRDLAAVGIQVNLAPVLDVLTNPHNTVIDDRAYGDDPETVAALGQAYVAGLQGTGTLAVAKHFPGHGGTAEDSHLTLPVESHDRAWLEANALRPFHAAIDAGVAGIMVAHVSYPALDPVPDRPASLSPAIISGLLRQAMGYDGLVLTDDLGAMRAITDHVEAGEAAVRAVEAGSDLLIVTGSAERQRRMVTAVHDVVGTRISPAALDAAVGRVLRAKWRAGLLGPAPPATAAAPCPPGTVSLPG